MAQYFKLKENELNTDILTYFNIADLNYYEDIFIIHDKDYKKFVKKMDFDNIAVFSKDSEINDDKAIYLNLKVLNESKIIYLKEHLNILEDDSIKSFIISFRGIIICNIELVNYLNDNNIINDEVALEDNKYVEIDKYGIKKVIDY